MGREKERMRNGGERVGRMGGGGKEGRKKEGKEAYATS